MRRGCAGDLAKRFPGGCARGFLIPTLTIVVVINGGCSWCGLGCGAVSVRAVLVEFWVTDGMVSSTPVARSGLIEGGT